MTSIKVLLAKKSKLTGRNIATRNMALTFVKRRITGLKPRLKA